MNEIIIKYLPYILSAITLYTMFLAGNKTKNAWVLGGFNQVLWFIWISFSGSWGLLPMTIGMCVVYFRNYLKWKHESV